MIFLEHLEIDEKIENNDTVDTVLEVGMIDDKQVESNVEIQAKYDIFNKSYDFLT